MDCVKSDVLLDNSGLRTCCNVNPIFHQFTGLGCWAIECGKNGHIHNTGLCNSKEEAIETWNRRLDNGA